VRLSHLNYLASAKAGIRFFDLTPGESVLSYLPFAHCYEQGMFTISLVVGLKIGFFQGNPLKLIEDCATLKPVLFPSVPRLFNKLYSAIKGKFDQATGCKRFLLNAALSAKQANLDASGAVTHCCWDRIIFNKAAGILGGKVRWMFTGSAPIDKQVLDFMKICFSCPIVEGYGLTESGASGTSMKPEDTVMGHVGGPGETMKMRVRSIPD
jgi:long-chain acyl-CoA synthetase